MKLQGETILVTQAEPLYVYQHQAGYYVIWSFSLLQPNVEKSVTPPILISLTYPEGPDQTLLGKEAETGNVVCLRAAPMSLQQIFLPQKEKEWEKLTLEDQENYRFVLENEKAKKLNQLRYQFCWK